MHDDGPTSRPDGSPSTQKPRGIAHIALRPITDEDQALLAELYATTRRHELAPIVDWSQERKEAFLRQQFELQHRYYREQFKQASFDLLIRDGETLGRLYVDRRIEEIRIIDIALFPQFRGQGLGRAIMRALLVEAAELGVPVRIHVERFNPAMRLYHRLGFREIGDQGVYCLMESTAQAR